MYQYALSLLKFDIFNKGKKTFIDNFTNIINNSQTSDIMLMLQNKKIRTIIISENLFWKNIELISKKVEEDNIVNSIRLLCQENNSQLLSNKEKLFSYYHSSTFYELYLQYLIINKVDMNEIIKYLKENKISAPYNTIVKSLLTVAEGKVIIKAHLNYFLDNNRKLLEFKKLMGPYGVEYEIDEKIDTNKEIVVEEIVGNRTNLTLDNLKHENVLESLIKLISQVIDSENKTWNDLKQIENGSVNDVYQIGDKVLKVGACRDGVRILNNKRFLKPLYRKNVYSSIDKKPLFFIEVTERVDFDNVNMENVYQIYKEFRDAGLVWMDCRLNNVGRLNKDNNAYFRGKAVKVPLESTDYLTENNEILPKGEIVIIDSNYIFDLEEFKKLNQSNSNLLKNINRYDSIKYLEDRYQKEYGNISKII